MRDKKIWVLVAVVLIVVASVVILSLPRTKSEADDIIAEYDKIQVRLEGLDFDYKCDAIISERIPNWIAWLEMRTADLEAEEGAEAVAEIKERRQELDDWSEIDLANIDLAKADCQIIDISLDQPGSTQSTTAKNPDEIKAKDRRLIWNELAKYYGQNNKWPGTGDLKQFGDLVKDDLQLVGFHNGRETWVGFVDRYAGREGAIYIQPGVKDKTTQGDVGQNVYLGLNVLETRDLIIMTGVVCPTGDTLMDDGQGYLQLQAGQDGASRNTLAMYYIKDGQLVCDDYKA